MHLDLKRSWWAENELCPIKRHRVYRILQTSTTCEAQNSPEMTDYKADPGQCWDAFGSEDPN